LGDVQWGHLMTHVFPAGSQQVGLFLRTTGGRVVRLGGGLFGPRGDRGSRPADAQLAAAAGGLAR